MAAITSAVVVAAGSAYAANRQAGAAKDAANAQRDAAGSAMGYQRERDGIFDQNIAPYLQAGNQALGQLNALNSGDYSGFENSPDYLYARQQTQQGVERGAASRGGLYSGGTNVDLGNALNGIASQNLGGYRSSLMNLAGLGQNSAVGAGNLGQQSSRNMADLYGQQGSAAANGAIGSANAWSNGIAGIAGAVGQYAGNRQSSYQPQSQWGAFAPNQPAQNSYGSLGPSNGNSWNFGQGWGT
ncbi:hypothetical protein [Pseudoxanthomonas sp. CF125]|uniref:hypothetical protein n=1 Tax=Pseudoxanthomonas sp. CF125 TaxID=1855303 RepID=UPI0008922028|nr:hypothetical protein [Pseudoxanthomonas sp. CF125]SDQ41986.1 hypothetical protein SAMN05216569_1056 [Pseudoxanthomonas sp. CF125]